MYLFEWFSLVVGDEVPIETRMQLYLCRGRSDFEETPYGFAFRNCCKRNCISKDNGQFQKAKLRLRRLFSLQPKVQHYSTPASLRVTSLCGVGCLRNFVRNKAFLISRRHSEHARIVVPVATYCSHLRARRSFCSRSEAERQKPPQAGSTESLMFPAESKELFYHKGCKFAIVGVDQTLRRPLRGASTP